MVGVMGKRLSEEQAFSLRFRSVSCVSSSESTSAGRGDFEACSNDIYIYIYMMIVFWSTVDLTKGLAMQRSLFCSLGRGWNEKAK